MILFFALGAAAQTTNGLPDAEIQGRKLAQQLCDARPAENSLSDGVLKYRTKNGNTISLPVYFQVAVTSTNWKSICRVTSSKRFAGSDANSWDEEGDTIRINHLAEHPNFYESSHYFSHVSQNESLIHVGPAFSSHWLPLDNDKLMTPFGGSDFWIADLGLEFFHWPGQKILKKEFARGRGCMVLESANPEPSTNGYSRVVSWIDEESGGIVQAEAYDFKNKLLKEFAPKSFKKVNGQWELQDMEIRNVQTGSRTRIEFDLKAK
jgi:hypothetical protein